MNAMTSTMRFQIESAGHTEVLRSSEVLSHAHQLAAAAGVTDDRSLKGIQQYLKSLAASARQLAKPGRITRAKRHQKSPSERIIEDAISSRRLEIESELKMIPPSLEKAWAALAHEIDDEDDGPPDALCAFGVDESKSRFKVNVDNRRRDLLSGNAMRTSARGYEPYWYASYLRYYETFEPKDARELLLSEARDVEDQMRPLASLVESGREDAAQELPHFVDVMVAHGRCRIVRNVLFRVARRAVPAVLRLQKPKGAWADWERPTRGAQTVTLLDDPATTAAAVIFLARYGSAEECEGALARSQKWLVQVQMENGSWVSIPTRGIGLPVSTTVQVLDALRLTGIPVDHPAVLKGESFLLSQQQLPGLWWERSGRWNTHVTAQVLEYFQSRLERPGALNSYLKSARALLLKSEQLSLSEDNADAQLATTAAYHGLEHFLYGCLLTIDSAEPIYADNKGTTIGFNDALGAFERALKEQGKVSSNARLPYRQQLKHLGAKRDMFVHRAESISIGDAFSFVATCRAFVQRYDLTLLGFRLCE